MGTYHVGKRIGMGASAEVLECRREEDGLTFALKRLIPFCDEEDRRRFRREVRMQAQLRHRNVVPIVAVNVDNDPPWFVMPRAECSLREYLSNHKGEDQVWIIHEIATGLKHAHDNGRIHRDLKPENVLFFRHPSGRMRVAVGDFGLGRFVARDSTTITEKDVSLGTVQYMAPEQHADAKNVDHRADIYALGKILYEVLTGESPYPEMDYSEIPRKFVYIVQKACQGRPDDRYSTVQGMIDDLTVVSREDWLLTKPVKTVLDEMEAILEEQDFTASRVEKLARLLVENTNDNEVLTGVLPTLTEPVLRSLIQNHMPVLITVLKEYDKAVSGPLPFSYCDIAANFYQTIFHWTDSDDLRVMILQRLPRLGYSHNRFHVGDVFAGIVSTLDDPSLLLAVRDILRSDEDMAAWCKFYLEKHSLPSIVAEVL